MDEASITGDDSLEDVILELVPFLRHHPNCPTEREDGAFIESACLCGLSATLDSLRDDHGIDVARCRGCGQHAPTPDGTEDWAWRKEDGEQVAYCHECAVARGA